MAAQNRDQYQGLLIPDVRLRSTKALWAAESSHTQAGPRTGVPVASRSSEAVLEGVGMQTAGTAVEVLAVDGGPVGRAIDAAGMAWRRTTDASTAYRGHELPITLSAWRPVTWEPTDGGYTTPHILTMRADKYRDRVVFVARKVGTNSIYAWTLTPTGTLSAPALVHDDALGNAAYPCLVEVGARLYCLHWVPGVGEASVGRWIRVQVSTDGGATWAIAKRYTAGSALWRESGGTAGTSVIGRIRAAYNAGQVLILAHLKAETVTAGHAKDKLYQYASTNLSLGMDEVDSLLPAPVADEESGGPMDIAVTGGVFVVAWLQTNGPVYWAQVGSAYSPLSGLAAGSSGSTGWKNPYAVATSDAITDYDIALMADDAGVVWMYLRAAAASAQWTNQVHVVYSEDSGKTFDAVGLDSTDRTSLVRTAALWAAGQSAGSHDVTHYPRNFACTWVRGRMVMVHGWYAATATTTRDSLSLAFAGGYSDLTTPPIRGGVSLVERMPWAGTRLPIERAQDTTVWTGSTSGTFTNVLASGYERFTGGDGAVAGSVSAYQDYAAVGDDLAMVTWAAKGSGNGASDASPAAAITIRVDNGARGVELGVYMTPTGFGVYDVVAASQLALITGLANEVREWRVGVYADEANTVRQCRVFYRSYSKVQIGDEDRQWNFVGAYSLTDDGGTIGANRVKYGILSSTAPQTVLDVYHGPHVSIGDLAASDCLAGSAYQWHVWEPSTHNPERLSLRPLSSSAVYYADGVELRATDGPAHKGDSWTTKTAYEYPIERIWPGYSRSPRSRWRSTDTSAQSIAVALDTTLMGTDESHAGAPLYALHLSGINWRQGSLEYYTGAAWAKVLDIDAGAAFGLLSFVREGATLLPNATGTAPMSGQELVGWDARIVAGDVRRIKGNRGGLWSTGTTAGPRARVDLAGVTGTEAASGSVVMCARSVTLVFEIPAATTLAGWRLKVDSQSTVEGYHEIGLMLLGRVWVAGMPPDWGRRTVQALGASYAAQQDGSTLALRGRPSGYGVEVAWPAPVDTTEFHAGGESHYITTTATSGVEGAATWTATVYDLAGELDAAGTEPLVYLPRIERGASSDLRTLTRWYDHLLCHATEGLTVTHPVGDEALDEMQTVGTLTLEPEL